jgi:hypothetical protein
MQTVSTEAAAGAGGGDASGLQQVRRQEQRDLQSDLGEVPILGSAVWGTSGFQQALSAGK